MFLTIVSLLSLPPHALLCLPSRCLLLDRITFRSYEYGMYLKTENVIKRKDSKLLLDFVSIAQVPVCVVLCAL
jgi:hypothetical protein